MIDEPFFVKYRPADLEDMVVPWDKENFAKRIAGFKAFLLAGPSGTGKTTLARIIANMHAAPEDVVEIDAATHTGIESMRLVAEHAEYPAFSEEGTKAVIIDEAHALSRQAIQSCLKIIEEPPKHLIWLFCTTDPSKLPETIRSRCYLLNMPKHDAKHLREICHLVLEEEGIEDFDSDILSVIVRSSEGNARTALINLQKCIGAVSVRDARSRLSQPDDPPEVIDLCRALLGKETFGQCIEIARHLENMPNESIRQVILRYCSTVTMRGGSNLKIKRALFIIDSFSQQCYPRDGIAPILLGIAEIKGFIND